MAEGRSPCRTKRCAFTSPTPEPMRWTPRPNLGPNADAPGPRIDPPAHQLRYASTSLDTEHRAALATNTLEISDPASPGQQVFKMATGWLISSATPQADMVTSETATSAESRTLARHRSTAAACALPPVPRRRENFRYDVESGCRRSLSDETIATGCHFLTTLMRGVPFTFSGEPEARLCQNVSRPPAASQRRHLPNG